MPLEPDADLDWAAFLYIGGELDADDEAAFERRLLDDQPAREAVARAVELAGALALIGPEAMTPSRPIRSSRRRAWAWSALATAACLALAGAWALRSAEPEPDAAEVAIAWSGLRRLDAIGSEIDWAEPIAEPHPSADLEAPGEAALPSWLLTAAALPVEGPQPEDN